MKSLEVSESSRIDGFIAKSQNVSRSFVKVLLDQGKVSLNDEVIYKPSTNVNAGDVIKLDFEHTELKDIPEIEIEILYEDDDCLVLNKPIGVLTHSKGAFNPEATVSTFIRQFTTGMEDNRGGIVHRLDRVTSGVLICAKHEKALDWLQKQFSSRKTKKIYNAVVSGILDPEEAQIDMPIERNPKKPQTFRVGPNGKPATTVYRVIETNGKHSLVELAPVTGRTHQLRVHMTQIGHPIVGDVLYGGEEADRTYLHALTLEITLLNKQKKAFTAPLPQSFSDMLEA